MKAAFVIAALSIAVALSCPAAAAPAFPRRIAPVIADIPAGDYRLDPGNSSITFRLSHLGFSHYTASFARFDARLHLDPAAPERARIFTTIDPNSLVLTAPPPGFRAMLLGPQWMNTAKYRAIVFRSTRVVMTGPDTARVEGLFSLHGVTRPVVLQVTFNGGYRGIEGDPHARVGFSVGTKFRRSDFGLGFGSHLIAGDEVDVEIEAEFTGPPPRKPVP